MTGLRAGWYTAIKDSAGAITCLYREPNGLWRLANRSGDRLPAGWQIGPRVDDLLNTHVWAEHARHLLTPTQLAIIEAELALENRDD